MNAFLSIDGPQLPSDLIAKELETLNTTFQNNVLKKIAQNTAQWQLTLENPISIFSSTDIIWNILLHVENSAIEFSKISKTLVKTSFSVEKHFSELFLLKEKWKKAKDHEERFAVAYKLDPGNAIYFEHEITWKERTYKGTPFEVIIFKSSSNTYKTVSFGKLEQNFKEGDRLLPTFIRSSVGNKSHSMEFDPEKLSISLDKGKIETLLKENPFLEFSQETRTLHFSKDPRGLFAIRELVKAHGLQSALCYSSSLLM